MYKNIVKKKIKPTCNVIYKPLYVHRFRGKPAITKLG